MGIRNLVLGPNKMTTEDVDRYVETTLSNEPIGEVETASSNVSDSFKIFKTLLKSWFPLNVRNSNHCFLVGMRRASRSIHRFVGF